MYDAVEFLLTWTLGGAGLLLQTLAHLMQPLSAVAWARALAATGVPAIDAESRTEAAAEAAWVELLAAAAADESADLAAAAFIQQGDGAARGGGGLRDAAGRPAMLVLASRFSPAAYEPARAARYVLREVEACAGRAGDGDYAVVVVATGADPGVNAPPAAWLRGLWAALPPRRRSGLRQLVVLHPGLHLRAALWALAPPELQPRVTYVHRLEFLWDVLAKRTCPELPAAVAQHDAELETHPLIDYGIVAMRPATGPDAAM